MMASQAIKTKLASLDFYLNDLEQAVICRSCKYALQSSADGVARHLAQKHSVAKSERRNLTSLVKTLRLPDPNTLPCRQDGSPPHPELALQAGVACKICAERSTSLDVIVGHLAKCHGVRSNKQSWMYEHIDQWVCCRAGRRPASVHIGQSFSLQRSLTKVRAPYSQHHVGSAR